MSEPNVVLQREDPKTLHNQFTLLEEDVWIKVKNLNVCIHNTDEGVVVDIWGKDEDDEPLASTYAYYSEGKIDE